VGVLSGRYGQVNGVNTLRQWSINDTLSPAKAVASNTLQGTARKKGVRNWSGSFNTFGAAKNLVLPGDSFSFVGYGAPDNGVAGAAGLRYSGTALCKSVAITWNWESGDILSQVVQFEGSLELTKASGADPGDAVAPVLPEVGPTDIKWAAGNLTNFASLPNMTQATLTITAAVTPYVNSSTYINGFLWTGKKAGPIDWTLAIQQEDTERLTNIFEIGDVVNLKLFTDASLYWLLTYGFVRDFTGITVNRETGAIISRTINIDMNAYYGSTAGQIAMPGGTVYWPF